MLSFLYVVLSGFLVRADGWGTDDPRWKPAAKFFNVWSCGGLFALISAFFVSPLVALAAGGAFVAWRLPGFNKWEDWENMFWRGAWTSFIGFTLVSLAAHDSLLGGVLSVPFSIVYASIYAFGYKYLPQEILGFNKHVWIEHASGWAFSVFILAVIYG